jgi:hypothetical protein
LQRKGLSNKPNRTQSFRDFFRDMQICADPHFGQRRVSPWLE